MSHCQRMPIYSHVMELIRIGFKNWWCLTCCWGHSSAWRSRLASPWMSGREWRFGSCQALSGSGRTGPVRIQPVRRPESGSSRGGRVSDDPSSPFFHKTTHGQKKYRCWVFAEFLFNDVAVHCAALEKNRGHQPTCRHAHHTRRFFCTQSGKDKSSVSQNFNSGFVFVLIMRLANEMAVRLAWYHFWSIWLANGCNLNRNMRVPSEDISWRLKNTRK